MTTKTLDQQTARFISSIATCLPRLSSDVIQGWIDNPQGLKRNLSGLNPPAVETTRPVNLDIFRLTIDYSQSLEQMIAAGKFDWKNSDITAKRFPLQASDGVIECEGRYFHFDRNTSSEDMIKAIESTDTANPWMPAKIEHLLSFGEKFPDEQRKFPIVGLGSVAEVYGYRSVPYLDRYSSKRDLCLIWFDCDWSPIYRFLAVRKISAS